MTTKRCQTLPPRILLKTFCQIGEGLLEKAFANQITGSTLGCTRGSTASLGRPVHNP